MTDWNNKEEVLRAIRSRRGYLLKYASDELKNDKEVVLAAVQNNGNALEHASEEIRVDKEVVLAAVKQDKWVLGWKLQNADDSLKNDPEFMKEVEQYLE